LVKIKCSKCGKTVEGELDLEALASETGCTLVPKE
jgi:hypothetical protein